MPISILDAETLRQIYLGDKSLFSAIQCLHDELAKCIPPMINVLLRGGNDSKAKKFAKSLYKDPIIEVESILKPHVVRRDLQQKSVATTATKLHLLSDILDQGVASLHKGLDGGKEHVTATANQNNERMDARQKQFLQAF
ncbi:hypothetical protein FAVG1_06937 [Fusarium avenaceum]|nr:hypothetical protein FAVG1_06937 [Fusarium avenaceum]